jgi:hypothetical protein
VLPLHSLMVLPPGTRCGCLSTVFGIRITLIITRRRQPWPHSKHHAAGRVDDVVGQFSCQRISVANESGLNYFAYTCLVST